MERLSNCIHVGAKWLFSTEIDKKAPSCVVLRHRASDYFLYWACFCTHEGQLLSSTSVGARTKLNPRATLPFRTLKHLDLVCSGFSLPVPVLCPAFSAAQVAVSVARSNNVCGAFGELDVGSLLEPVRVKMKLTKPPSPRRVESWHSLSVTSNVVEPRPRRSPQSRAAYVVRVLVNRVSRFAKGIEAAIFSSASAQD